MNLTNLETIQHNGQRHKQIPRIFKTKEKAKERATELEEWGAKTKIIPTKNGYKVFRTNIPEMEWTKNGQRI